MFGRKRNDFSDVPVEEIENILGVLLENRPSIVNFGDIAKSNIFAGSVIGKAFNEDQEKLSDEFDLIVLFFGRELLREKGVRSSTIEAAQEAIFKNLIDPNDKDSGQYLATCAHRLRDYESLANMNDIASRLLKNIAIVPMNERERQSSVKLSEQLSAVRKFMSNGLDGELKAAAAQRR